MDALQTVLLTIVLFLLLYWMTHRKPVGLPPGPLAVPFVGYYPFLGPRPFETLKNLSRKYGGVFTLPMFGTYAIVLNDWKSVKEALVLQNHVFTGRPPTFLSKLIMKRADVIFSDGMGWKERRRFTLHHLRDFGFGKKSMEGVIMDEVNKLSDHLRKVKGQKIGISNLFFFSFMNIIWTLVASKRYEPEDTYMLEFTEILNIIFDQFTTNNPINFVPLLRHLPGSRFRRFLKASNRLEEFLTKEVDEHLATRQEGYARDFIDVYLDEIEKQQLEKGPSSTRSFQRTNLGSILRNLFNAGIDTGSNTLSWGILYMITWPKIQRKVQQEMDAVIGRSRLPTIEDRNMLPYTEAVLMEIQRCASIVPLSVLHYTLAPSEIQGYTIPKSSVIFENIWAVHRDPECWGDPEVFRPERFLNAEGKVQKPEYFIPFSVGGRMCLGEPLAKMEMFLFFTCLLHQFSFSGVTGEKPPSLEPVVRVTLKPEPFSLTVTERQ